MNFDKAVEIALKTWYPKDHDLHLNPHHPLGKLLGEWGELLDDYMKSLYKPGYAFEPQDELGDIWYYLRILCYQKGDFPKDMIDTQGTDKFMDTDFLIAKTAGIVSSSFLNAVKGYDYHYSTLDYSYSALIEIARRYNLTLDDLTASNWEKLKPGSVRGDEWQGAGKIETDYKGGKIALK